MAEYSVADKEHVTKKAKPKVTVEQLSSPQLYVNVKGNPCPSVTSRSVWVSAPSGNNDTHGYVNAAVDTSSVDLVHQSEIPTYENTDIGQNADQISHDSLERHYSVPSDPTWLPSGKEYEHLKRQNCPACHQLIKSNYAIIVLVAVCILSVLISVAISYFITDALQDKIEAKPGPEGPKGDPGIAGIKGGKGDLGVTGSKGSKGAKGAGGVPGADGVDGADGVPGEKGTQGDMGAKGDKGEPAP